MRVRMYSSVRVLFLNILQLNFMIKGIYLKLVEKLRRSIKEISKNKIEEFLENKFKNPKPEIQKEKRNYEALCRGDETVKV